MTPSDTDPTPPGDDWDEQRSLEALRRECDALRQERDALRSERDTLRAKIDAIAQAISAPDAGKIVHDVRNVMNELVLLRKLVELEE